MNGMERNLSEHFRRMSNHYLPHSPLYSRLAKNVADDLELIAIAADAKSSPVSNLFFAAAHSLLLEGKPHSLADFYPSVSNAPPDKGNPFPHFRDFCLEHEERIQTLISTRRVQTNEVKRCACLLPAFGMASRMSGKPLALVEVGASAGLNLLFDRYRYEYGDGNILGNEDSPVEIHCETRGEKVPPFPENMPKASSRIGLDLEPLDVRNPDDARWLEALIWPEEYARRAPMLRRAIEVARKNPPKILRGDALESLPKVLSTIPENAAPCVFHTFTVNQFSEEMRERLTRILVDSSRNRPVYRVSIEWIESESPLLRLAVFDGGNEEEKSSRRATITEGGLNGASPATDFLYSKRTSSKPSVSTKARIASSAFVSACARMSLSSAAASISDTASRRASSATSSLTPKTKMPRSRS